VHVETLEELPVRLLALLPERDDLAEILGTSL
jgi:hypothetical protein